MARSKRAGPAGAGGKSKDAKGEGTPKPTSAAKQNKRKRVEGNSSEETTKRKKTKKKKKKTKTTAKKGSTKKDSAAQSLARVEELEGTLREGKMKDLNAIVELLE